MIHFVIKGPPPGVPRTDKNTLITGAALRIVEPDGTRKSTLKFYSGTDPLTIVEAGSAIYWRDQVENGFLTDQQAIEGLQAIQQHTLQNYIMLGSMNLHPGEVAITTGLTQLSLHYAIIYLDRLNLPDSTVRWMAQQHAKGPSFERVNDYKKAESLKAALAHADVAPEFLIHLKASVTGTKILEFEQRATQENELSQEHIRKQTHLCFEGSPLRDLLKEYVDRSPHLTARNDHNNCLNVLAPILDFGYRDGAVVPSLSKYTTDTCVFELACYILASADFWAFNNAPDKRPHIQQILFSQLDALTSRSGFLPEEASFDYANSRLGVYGRIAATNFSVEGFHLRLKQALAYAANNSKPPVNLDDVAPIFGDPIEGLALTRALVDWDIDRMTGMDSTLSLIC